jgi:hypothetical protein
MNFNPVLIISIKDFQMNAINTFARTALALALVAAAAGSALAHDVVGVSGAQANGAMGNSISVNTFSNGNGNASAVAGSTGMTQATISATATGVHGSEGVYSSNVGATGSVDTRTTGYVGLIGSGNATGSASMTGFSDGGTTGYIQGRIANNATFSGTGFVDSGRPINVNRGPDVTIGTTTLGSGVVAGGIGGGTFAIHGSAAVTENGSSRSVNVNDTKDVSSYSATGYSAMTLNNAVLNIQNGSVQQLDSGAVANAQVSGNYNLSVNANLANLE